MKRAAGLQAMKCALGCGQCAVGHRAADREVCLRPRAMGRGPQLGTHIS